MEKLEAYVDPASRYCEYTTEWEDDSKMSTENALRELKRKVMSKKRKVIFDNDGGDVARLCKGITNSNRLSR